MNRIYACIHIMTHFLIIISLIIVILQKNEKATAPHGYAPNAATQRELLASFSELRSQIANIRSSKQIPKCPVKLVSTNLRHPLPIHHIFKEYSSLKLPLILCMSSCFMD